MRVHVVSPDGEAKFWMEPEIELDFERILHPENYPLVAKSRC